MEFEIATMHDFRRWVKTQLAYQDIDQKRLSEKMQIPPPRISEAIYGKVGGHKFIVPIIEAIGGNVEDFKAIL